MKQTKVNQGRGLLFNVLLRVVEILTFGILKLLKVEFWKNLKSQYIVRNV